MNKFKKGDRVVRKSDHDWKVWSNVSVHDPNPDSTGYIILTVDKPQSGLKGVYVTFRENNLILEPPSNEDIIIRWYEANWLDLGNIYKANVAMRDLGMRLHDERN